MNDINISLNYIERATNKFLFQYKGYLKRLNCNLINDLTNDCIIKNELTIEKIKYINYYDDNQDMHFYSFQYLAGLNNLNAERVLLLKSAITIAENSILEISYSLLRFIKEEINSINF